MSVIHRCSLCEQIINRVYNDMELCENCLHDLEHEKKMKELQWQQRFEEES